jgi:Ala-tRNA(Pro) deacylase
MYERIISFLERNRVRYEVLEHAPEGRTDIASRLRGHPLSQAAKSMVASVPQKACPNSYYLVVVPGDRRVNLRSFKTICGKKGQLAPTEIVTELTGCVIGAVPPFTFHPRLRLLADSHLREESRIVFSAGRLDRSIVITMDDYSRLARPTFCDIATVVSEPASYDCELGERTA